MKVQLGVKSDPIESRYSFDWLFGLMREHGVHRLQYGSSTVTLLADDEYFKALRRTAERYDIRISSMFSSIRGVRRVCKRRSPAAGGHAQAVGAHDPGRLAPGR